MFQGIFNLNAPRRLPVADGPNAVRSYITQTLISKFDFTPAVAEETALQWNLARRHDLVTAPLESFQRVFARRDVAAAVFQSVSEDLVADWWNSWDGIRGSASFVLAMAVAVFYLIRAAKGSTSKESTDALKRFLLAIGPLLLVSVLQWPSCGLKFAGLFVSLCAIFLRVFLWLCQWADGTKELRKSD